MPKPGQFDPRKEKRGNDMGDVTPEMAEAFYLAAENNFRHIQAALAERSSHTPWPPQIPEALALIAITGYNEF